MAREERLPMVAVDSKLPGWSFWPIDDGPDAVTVRCGHCKSIGMLVKHSIDTKGVVQASINCCEPGHIMATLENWPSNLEKKAGAVGVCRRLLSEH